MTTQNKFQESTIPDEEVSWEALGRGQVGGEEGLVRWAYKMASVILI